MVRTTSRVVAALFILALVIFTISSPVGLSGAAFAGGGTGVPPPPDSSSTPNATTPGEEGAAESFCATFLYLIAIGSMVM